MEKKFTIEKLVDEVAKYLKNSACDMDTFIYYNGKRLNVENGKIETDIHPYDYFPYYADRHIFSMSFEGDFYDIMNYCIDGNTASGFEKLLKKYGLYYELGNSWNLSVYPISDNLYEKIDYTDYTHIR